MLTADGFYKIHEAPAFKKQSKKTVSKQDLIDSNDTISVLTVLDTLKANAHSCITSKLIMLKTGLGRSTVTRALRILVAKDLVLQKERKKERATTRLYMIKKAELRN